MSLSLEADAFVELAARIEHDGAGISRAAAECRAARLLGIEPDDAAILNEWLTEERRWTEAATARHSSRSPAPPDNAASA